jgi:hypothetical protein
MGHKTPISYSISQVIGIADQQMKKLKKANENKKIEPQSESSRKYLISLK